MTPPQPVAGRERPGRALILIFVFAGVAFLAYLVLGMPGMDHSGDDGGMTGMEHDPNRSSKSGG